MCCIDAVTHESTWQYAHFACFCILRRATMMHPCRVYALQTQSWRGAAVPVILLVFRCWPSCWRLLRGSRRNALASGVAPVCTARTFTTIGWLQWVSLHLLKRATNCRKLTNTENKKNGRGSVKIKSVKNKNRMQWHDWLSFTSYRESSTH